MGTVGVRGILLIIAIICFVLDALGLDLRVDLTPIGLAFFAAAFLVGEGGWGGRRV
jgi:hypothetical protein